MGADYIECDVQITKDLKLICSHEAWINEVCDVENHSEFSDRIRYNAISILPQCLNEKKNSKKFSILFFPDLTILMMTIQISIGTTKE